MKQLRYLILAIAVVCCGASVAAAAREGDKASATSASAGGSDCCAGHAKSASASACTMKSSGTSATSAAMPRKGASKATMVAASGSCAMSAEQCKAMQGNAAMSAHCAKGMSASAMGNCPMHGGTAGATASRCEMHGMANHADCAVCANEASCDDEVRATGARAQVVSLRNGAMIVYTADGAGNIRALQSAVARHNERVVAALSGKSDSELCSECKQLRGAMASGKFNREIVNVQRGCQVLLTSSDQAIVQKIHEMTSPTMAIRVKS